MTGTKPGGRCCDVDIQVNDLDRQAPPEIVDELDRFVTPPCRADETLRERRGCHRQPVPLVERLSDHRARVLVVCVVAAIHFDLGRWCQYGDGVLRLAPGCQNAAGARRAVDLHLADRTVLGGL